MSTLRVIFIAVFFALAGCVGGGTDPTTDPPPDDPIIEDPTEPESPDEPPEEPDEPEPKTNAVGQCDPVYAEIIQRVADSMGVDAAGQSWAYCDHYTPGYRERTWPAWGWLFLDCRPVHWMYLLGCSQGWSFDGIRTTGGNIGGLLIPPSQMDILISEAQAMGLSPGNATWAEIRCLPTPERYAAVLVHEIHHSWHAMEHSPEMTAADTAAREKLMREHGEWLRSIPIPGCPNPRRLTPDTPITERIEP